MTPEEKVPDLLYYGNKEEPINLSAVIRQARIEGKIEAMRECLEMADKAAHDVFDDSGYDDGSAAWAVHEKIRKRIKQLENQK